MAPRNLTASPFGSLLCFGTILFAFYYLYTKYDNLKVNLATAAVTSSTTELPITSTSTRAPVWDTMDGEGYQFSEEQAQSTTMDPRFAKLDSLPMCTHEKVQEKTKEKMKSVMTDFLNCIRSVVEQWKGEADKMNIDWVEKARVCDSLPIFQDLAIEPIANLHEIKWTVLPKCKEQNVLVTLGVGHDTVAEEILNRTLPNTKFYGADPIIEPNRRMYSAFGKFFPFAIGRNAGFSKFRVLPNQNQRTRTYVDEDVITIDFIYFLKNILKLKRIDFAWIDTEGGEFEILDQFHKNGTLDKEGISICQFNLEVHSKFHPPGAQVFHDFIFRVLEEQRYVFLNSLHTDVGVHRMFFINVENEECVAKFFNDYS